MSRNRQADCCEYREEKRRLAVKKLRKKMEEAKDAPKKRIDDCEDAEEDDNIGQEQECEEDQANKVETLSKVVPLDEKMMNRIKPSIKDREKYSMQPRHIRCFLEPAELERLELEDKAAGVLKRFPCQQCESKKKKIHDGVPPWRQKLDGKKKKKKKIGKKKDEAKKVDEAEEKHEETPVDEEKPEVAIDRPVADEENVLERHKSKKKFEGTKPEKEKPMKSEFWCREVKKKVEVPDSSEDEIDCSDSICSFDSHVDLSGLALNREDMKKILDARRGRMATKVQSEKKST